ncbi:MAG: TIGR00268 family protein [Dehalococcoidia bacterium]|nr:TIGR00268 family protein [Dehalococcoidia bacterium]
MLPEEKLAAFNSILKRLGNAVVAFSGGVDSTFLAAAAHRVLGDEAIAVTAVSASYPDGEIDRARAIADEIGIRLEIVYTEELANPEYVQNNPDRCFHCKSALADKLEEVIRNFGGKYDNLLYGAIADDVGDYRPGMTAAESRGIRAPLVEAGFTKDDVRSLSKDWGLSTWDDPAAACLSSRIPYGTPVTVEALRMIDQAEAFLKSLGFPQVRVRHHEEIARIEVDPADIPRFFVGGQYEQAAEVLKTIGYRYVTLDLQGYRTGSLNESLLSIQET